MLLVCDQPRLSAEHLRALTLEFASRGGAAAVASGYEGALGVPAVFPRSMFVDLLRLTGDQGARALLRNPPCEVVEISFPGGGLDIDRPEDLAEFE